MTLIDQPSTIGLTVPIDRLVANPHNPRAHLGDLSELVRSIKAHGILQPLLVLPADEAGIHVVIAGHRRLAAAGSAGVEELPVVLRELTLAEQLEVALSENGNREGLDLTDEIAAIERLMSLDDALTPSRLSKRIGKSQAWVRDRMAVTVLPARWRAAIGKGTISLGAAVAAAGAADLGPEHLDVVCGLMAERTWRDPKQTVEDYRRDLTRAAKCEAAIAKQQQAGLVVFHDGNAVPSTARRLVDLGLDTATQAAHVNEPCHGVTVTKGWGDKPDVAAVCIEPRRHRPTRAGEPASPIVAPTAASRAGGDDSYAKRKARTARLAAAAEMFARRRSGPSTSELTALALPVLIETAGHEALNFAAKILGLETDRPHTALRDLAAESPASLARVAGAVACGIAELQAYHSTGPTVAAWYRLLVNHGWDPDPWTAARTASIDASDGVS